MFSSMSEVVEAAVAVDRQVEAYNAHDVVAFAACYAEDVVIVDASGGELTRGRTQLAEQYARWFRNNPALRAEIVSRIEIGAFVIDAELLTGTADAPGAQTQAVAIYHVNDDGLIDRVQFLP
jgi:uncharacterized protein (TIGR02246 family)